MKPNNIEILHKNSIVNSETGCREWQRYVDARLDRSTIVAIVKRRIWRRVA